MGDGQWTHSKGYLHSGKFPSHEVNINDDNVNDDGDDNDDVEDNVDQEDQMMKVTTNILIIIIEAGGTIWLCY